MTNPWFGYGLGIESIAVGMSSGGQSGSVSSGGFEYARLMAGIDFRLSRAFGLGPFADFSMGTYSRYRIEIPGEPVQEGDIEETAAHQWLSLGVRGVVFP
jgi:hypothetical protein